MLLFFHYPPLCKKFREVESHTANYMIVARINLLRAGSWPHLTVLHPYFTLVVPDFSLKPGNKEKTWEKNGFLKQKSPQRNNKIEAERVGAPGDHEDKFCHFPPVLRTDPGQCFPPWLWQASWSTIVLQQKPREACFAWAHSFGDPHCWD